MLLVPETNDVGVGPLPLFDGDLTPAHCGKADRDRHENLESAPSEANAVSPDGVIRNLGHMDWQHPRLPRSERADCGQKPFRVNPSLTAVLAEFKQTELTKTRGPVIPVRRVRAPASPAAKLVPAPFVIVP